MNDSWITLQEKIKEKEMYRDPKALQLIMWISLFMDKNNTVTTTILELSTSLNINKYALRRVIERLQDKYFLIEKISAHEQHTNSTRTRVTIRLINKDKLVSHNVLAHEQHTSSTREGTLLQDAAKTQNDRLLLFLEEFNKLFSSHYRETNSRQRALQLRLKRYSFEEILQALRTLAKSSFHQGSNERSWRADPDFLLRSDEQIDNWLNRLGKPKDKKPGSLFDNPNWHV